MLLAKYEEDFSTHTLKCFMEEYMALQSLVNDEEQRLSICKMQEKFSITSVKGEYIFPPCVQCDGCLSLLCANNAVSQNAHSLPSLLTLAPKVLLVSLLNGKLQQQERRCIFTEDFESSNHVLFSPSISRSNFDGV